MSDHGSSVDRPVKAGSPNGSADSYSPVRNKGGRSRSRSYSPRRRRSASRSPGSNRRRHIGDREKPTASRCLGVFGLSLYTQTRHLREVFTKYGSIDEITIVTDAQTGRSRGFAFVYFESVDDAEAAKEACNGIDIDNRKIRVDYSITKRPHTPTPGIYMGRPTQSVEYSRRPRGRRGYGGGYGYGHGGGGYDDRRGGGYDDRRGGGYDDRRGGDYRDDYRRGGDYRDDYRRSPPSPHHRRSGYRGRSRSRSYSPDNGRYRY